MVRIEETRVANKGLFRAECEQQIGRGERERERERDAKMSLLITKYFIKLSQLFIWTKFKAHLSDILGVKSSMNIYIYICEREREREMRK